MRERTWLGGLALAAIAMIGCFTLSGAAPDPKAPPLDDRDLIVAKLLDRVTIEKNKAMVDTPLHEVLDFLSQKFELTLLVDSQSFDGRGAAAAALKPNDGVLGNAVSLPAMKNVRLATVLKHLGDQIGGVYLVYPDHVKFVNSARAFTITNPPMKNYYPVSTNDADPNNAPMGSPEQILLSIPLVNVSFNDRPLREALRDIEVRTNRSIALAPQSGEKGSTPITTRFTNVPVDTAVATLAEMAGLKMALKGNVLLVTTVERAKEFDPPPPAAPMMGFGGGLIPNAPPTLEAQIDELKKKVAELEKTIAEQKKEKK